MKHWLDVFQYEVRQQFRRKAYLFITFIVPLLAIAAFYGYQFYRDSIQGGEDEAEHPITEEIQDNSTRIGYVDLTEDHMFPPPDSYPETDCTVKPEDANNLSPEFIKRISSPYCMRGNIRAYDTQAAGEQALDNDQIDVLYVIEPNYAENSSVSLYMSGFSIEDASSDQIIEDYMLASLLYNVDPATYEQLYLRLRDPAVINEHILGDSGIASSDEEGQNFILVYAFGIILMMSLFWGGGYLMQSVVQEKESRIVEIILSSVNPIGLLTGKTLAMGAMSLLQVGTLVGTFVFLIGQGGDLSESIGDVEISPVRLGLMVVYFILGFLFFGGLMAAIGAVSSSVRESQNFVVVVTLPATIPFFFLSLFAEEPNGTLATTLSFLPITGPLSMIMRVAVADISPVQIIATIAIQVLSVLFALWFAGRLFRVNILLMGNTPKFRDLPKLLRG